MHIMVRDKRTGTGEWLPLEKAAELMGPAADEIELPAHCDRSVRQDQTLRHAGVDTRTQFTAVVQVGQHQNVSAVSRHHQDAGVSGADGLVVAADIVLDDVAIVTNREGIQLDHCLRGAVRHAQ